MGGCAGWSAPVLFTNPKDEAQILVASLTLVALFKTEPATSIYYDTLMKNCFKDWSQSN